MIMFTYYKSIYLPVNEISGAVFYHICTSTTGGVAFQLCEV